MNTDTAARRLVSISVILAVFSLLLVSVSLLPAGPAEAGFFQAGTRTPGRSRTPTPTRTLAPPSLKRQAVFAGLGGGGFDCVVLDRSSLPVVLYEQASAITGFDKLCLVGFPQGEPIRITIYDPNNRQLWRLNTIVQNDSDDVFQPDVSRVYLMPVPYPAAGHYRVVAERPGSVLEAGFDLPSSYPDFRIAKSVPPGTPAYDSRRTKNLSPGETLLANGQNYPPNQEFPVAIYRAGNPLTLVTAQTVRTDKNGKFSAGFPITNQFSPGAYHVEAFWDHDPEYLYPIISNDFFVIQPSQPCPGAQPSRIQKNLTAIVSAGPPNNVREKAGLSSRLIGKLYEYEALEILKGPLCADGMVWWKVRSLNTGVDGWTAEGKSGDYWINSMGP